MAIKIVFYSEVIDNWGRTTSSNKSEIIFSVLNDTENFNDDMTFEDDNGRCYSIDELINKEVLLEGMDIFIVPDDEN